MILKWPKSKRRKGRKRPKKAPVFYSASDYFRQEIFGNDETWYLRHPTGELWLREQILSLCKKGLGTQLVLFLDELLQQSDDAVVRGVLARKIYQLQNHYLQSYKEYSDRALILLTQRQKFFDKWEGVYILGHFGGKRAIPYLRDLLLAEGNPLLVKTIERAILRIEENARNKKLMRGFE